MARPSCECNSDSCMEGLPMDEERYQAERARFADSPRLVFVLVAGHETPDDEIVRRGTGYHGEGFVVVREAA